MGMVNEDNNVNGENKMTTNNYDKSTTGLDIELNAGIDTWYGQTLFEENLTLLQDGCRKTPVYMFGESKPDSLSDCFDFSDCTRKDFRAFCIEYLNQSPKDTIEEKFLKYLSWEEFALSLLDEDLTFLEFAREEIPTIPSSKPLYEVFNTSGYSQGDYAFVLVEEAFEGLQNHINNLFWDCPGFVTVTINGEDYNLLQNEYEYEKSDCIEEAKKQGLNDQVTEFLESNLPEYLGA